MWADWNQDGIWSEPDERVLTAASVVDGQNQVSVAVPSNAYAGETCLRFRLSSSGGLPVTGFAPDGEVEDYMVTIAPTWTNPVNHLDVTNDTHVVPQDALVIINYLNDHPGDSSPPPPPAAPPPYYDVTGDGNIVAQDAIWIINYLNDQLSSGEGEVVPARSRPCPPQLANRKLKPCLRSPVRTHGGTLTTESTDNAISGWGTGTSCVNGATLQQQAKQRRSPVNGNLLHIARARCDHESFRGIDEWMGRFEIELVDEEVLDKLCDRRGQLERLRI